MELDIYSQIFDQFKRASKVLVALPEQLTVDSIASGAALFHFLKKLQKDVELVSAGPVPDNLEFLPDLPSLQKELSGGPSFVISLDIQNKPLAELSYQTGENSLNIFLKSKAQSYLPEDVSFTNERSPIDLVVTLGCPSLAALGKLFEQNADVFYETPKINIDNKASNELFGAINLVDITATSIAEILSLLFEKYEQQLVDEEMATQLLAGIIASTHSFQHPHTTPRAFLKASDLVALGGRQQEIIKNVFKTKPLALLKLWGRALARMKVEDDRGMIYSQLNPSDFEKAEAGASELYSVLKEFIDNVSNYRVIAVLAEALEGQTELLLALHPTIDHATLQQKLGENGEVAEFPLGSYKVFRVKFSGANLQQAENKFLELMRQLPLT